MSIVKLHRQGLLAGLLVVCAAGFSLPAPVAATAISAANQQAGAYALDPPLGTAGAAPLVMLNISRDQALFFKAYNDFSDLNNDGTLETTYTDSIDYAGYFDPKKCYSYSSSDGYFSPDSLATGTNLHYCTDKFSGNFLNWASMTRMDELRKILYGGKRSTDTDSLTVLERAYLPTDAHSFAKFYDGSDMSSLVPSAYVGNTAAPTGTASKADTTAAITENSTDYVRWEVKNLSSSVAATVGDQLKFTDANGGSTPFTVITGVRDFNNSNPRVRLENGQFFNTTCSGLSGIGANDCLKQLKDVTSWKVVNLSRTGLTICNTTVQGGSDKASQNNTAPPLMRLTKGNYALWGANEQKQCLWKSEKSNSQSGFVNGFLSNGNRAAFSGVPASAENPVEATTFNARVKVCVSGLIGTENCKQYPDANNTNNPYKPTGLLQKYGESGDIKFGLVTPSYDKNVSGGVLRAALPGPGTNSGNFISSEISPTTGQKTGNAGIISTLDKLRIYGYRYDQGDSYESDDGCPYQKTGIAGGGTSDVTEGKCSSWGNPMAESYVETLRYLAHRTANTNFIPGTSGKDAALGLSVATWNDPISEANYCAALNVLNINASAISYDTDQLGGFADLSTGKTAVQWTNAVGNGEGITGKSWFVGNSSSSYTGTDTNLCSAKTVANFGDVLGLCPEVPALKGGYDIAGAAYGAHIKRIRDLGNNSDGNPIVPTDDRTSLRVSTFGVQLATNTPQIRVQVPGSTNKFITIIPAYRLVLGSGVGGGELVDFKVLSQSSDGTTARGTFYANWEDSFAGGDFDQDMWGIITYEITASKVKITTKPVSASTNNGQGFGYIINGTNKDGPHFHSGIYSFNYTDPTNIDVYNAAGTKINGTGNINASGGCVSCVVSNPATTAIYDVGSTSAGVLEDPLLYASKWGGFKVDTNKPDGTDTPANDANSADHTKWDADGDGIPDNYFLVTDPGKLETSLDTLFRKILAKIASGTAAAVVATSSNGVGLTYQALYEQQHKDDSGRVASWAGSLAGFWTDAAGYLREDANHNYQLDDYTVDPVVIFSYQSGAQKTIVNRYFSDDPDVFNMGTAIPVDLDQVNTVWNARDWLWSPTLKVNTNRSYTAAATNASTTAGGRYIFTWIDKNHDGKVDTGESVPFEWSSFSGTYTNPVSGKTDQLYRFLNSDDGATNGEANKLVKWIRGAEVTGLRNRTVDYNTANTNRILRLGDIINSTPLAVSTPAESYDLLYNDTTYASFRNTYRNRRQVIYVGANDGMIHAFNGGFYNTSCQRLTTRTDSAVCSTSSPNTTANLTGTQTAHPLGAELWAYVPGNLLPHLRWLADPNYQHVYYADGSPIAFDAKVWGSGDTTHVGGWGTIMVVPFRLGGGTITVNASNNSTDNITSESAYVVMDITNPEAAPTVLAEIRATGARSVSVPAVVVVRQASSGSPNKFFLAVGNGPTNATRVASSNPLSVKIYDVADLKNGTVSVKRTFNMQTDSAAGGAEAVSSFAGDLIASDYDLNGLAESLYFGSVRDGGTDEFGGAFWKIAVNGDPDPTNWTATEMLSLKNVTPPVTGDIGRPVTVRPTLGRNNRGAPMVFFGTGRLFNTNDKATSGQQRIYGVIDTSLLSTSDAQYSTAPVPGDKVVDVTNIDVFTDKSITGSSDATTFDELSNLFDTTNYLGWYRDLAVSGTNPSERVVSSQTLLGSVLLTNTYVPGTSICTGLGTSSIFGLNYKTGTADPGLTFFGTSPSGGKDMVNPSQSLGQGLPAPPSLHLGSTDNSGGKKVTACIQTSTGAIICKDIVTLTPVTSSEQSWREPIEN